MNVINFRALKEILRDYRDQKVLLTFHSIGDTDSVSSALALSLFFKKVRIATPDFITTNCKHILKHLKFKDNIISKSFDDSADLVIMLDVNNFEDCGNFKEKLSIFKNKILIIDHHALQKVQKNNVYIYNNELQNSTASIVYDLLNDFEIKLNKNTAKLLAMGIISDSAEFKNAFPKTFVQIGKLLNIADVDYALLLKDMEHLASPEIREQTILSFFKSTVMLRNELLFIYGFAPAHANHSADSAIRIGADVALFHSISNNQILFSARLRPPLDRELGIHLGVIMKNISYIINGHGGGHPCAAGAHGTMINATDQFIERFTQEITKKTE